jgi:putative transposase
LFQSDRNANLMIDVLRSCVVRHELELRDFVVMPDHIHLLITVDGQMTVEKAMQLIKGRFSYRLKKELGYLGEVWQRGFSEVSVYDESSLKAHREYIAWNPVRAGLVNSPEEYPYCFASLAMKKAGVNFLGFSARVNSCPDTSLGRIGLPANPATPAKPSTPPESPA